MRTRTRTVLGIAGLIAIIGTVMLFTPFGKIAGREEKISKEASSTKFELLDINEASQKEIEKLPMIGPSKAKAIFEYRKKIGAFQKASDLLGVPGIGETTLEKILPMMTGFSSSSVSVKPEYSPVNVNTSDARRLEELPYIGPSKAKEIVDYRKSNGPFKGPGDLLKVKGIGEKTLDRIKDMISF